MKRDATAVWQGTGKAGKGHISTQSGVLKESPYAFNTRFEEAAGTNPEELVAAAHAGCFTMKLAFNLTEAGYEPEHLQTTCSIELDPKAGKITTSHLNLKAKVAGISKEKFEALAADAKANCPMSKLLNAEIFLQTLLEA